MFKKNISEIFIGKKYLFIIGFLFFCSILCYSQSISGKWERYPVQGNPAKIVLTFSGNTLLFEVIDGNKVIRSSVSMEVFASKNVLTFPNTGGTGRYSESMRFEYQINGNSLLLRPLNPNAQVAGMEGIYTRIR